MKIHKILTCLLLCTALIITQSACSAKEKAPISDTQYDLLNTTCTITIYDMKSRESQKLIDEAFSLCKDYENKLSKTIEGSDVYRINHSNGKPVEVSEATATLIKKGIYYGKLSEGHFDITVGKLSSLWDFTGDNPKVPSGQKIQDAIATIDYTKVHVEDIKNQLSPETESVNKSNSDFTQSANVWIENPNTELDLGGIAKGYIADCVSKFLVGKGIKSAIVDFGGNIVAIGEKKDGSSWNIGIEKPYSGRSEIVGSINVKNKTVVTSGIYERVFEENGVLYHHILDVKTGYPIETDFDSVSLIGDFGKSMDCDALSTIYLMLGSDKGLELIQNIDGVKALRIDTAGNIILDSDLEFTAPE